MAAAHTRNRNHKLIVQVIIYLVGYMGSGKSTIGRRLASAMPGWALVDTDRLIEQRERLTVSEIFARQGEGAFRVLEEGVLRELAEAQQDTIVATGGGMPCFGANMELMNASGFTVYLCRTPESLVARMKSGRERRPAIRGMDDPQLLEFIRTNLPPREGYYRRANMVIDCQGRSDDYITEHIAIMAELARQSPRPRMR